MDTHGLYRLLIDWVPFLIFLGLLIFFMARNGFGRKQSDYLAYMQKYCADHLEETRKISDSLQRIASALERSGNQG